MTALRELTGHFEGNKPSKRPASKQVGSFRLDGTQHLDVPGGHVFDSGVGRLILFVAYGLQAIEGPLVPHVPCQVGITQDVSAGGVDAEEGAPSPGGLDGYQWRPG